MKSCLPGTLIEINEALGYSIDETEYILNNIFSTGGLVLSQVSALTGLEGHTVQNWVKRGFLSSPVNKQYSKRQFCRIVVINMLKDVLQIEKAASLISRINGVLDDDSDDLIDDSVLYNYFVNIVYLRKNGEMIETTVTRVLKDYAEPVPGGKKRLSKILKAMYFAYKSVEYQKMSEKILYEFD